VAVSGRPVPRRGLALAVALLVLASGARATRPAGVPASHPIADAFPIVFDAEWVRLDVAGDSLEVHGTFLFLCREPVDEPVPLFFPFPRDSLLGEARMISLGFHAGGETPVPGRWEEVPGIPGVRWWIPPCAGDSVVADFVYRQEIREEYARYIVTSARVWGRPLRHAAFEIRLPPGAEPIEFSYPFERRDAGGGNRWAWETEGFFPNRDVVVRWHR
jgi:hypothetical protein